VRRGVVLVDPGFSFNFSAAAAGLLLLVKVTVL
jgi:hypothetical protein